MQSDGPVVIVQSAPRKQNIACDACRTRKVKCVMPPGHDKHCQLKNYACTFNVQRETTEKKKHGGVGRRRNSEGVKSNNSPTPLSTFPAADPNPTASVPTYYNHFQTTGRPPLAPAVDQTVPAGPPYIAPAITATSPSYPETPTSRLLAYLFSPSAPATSYPELNTGYRSLPDYQQRHLRVDDWGEVGVKLQDPIFRKEFATDLVEAYFEICHTRIALIGPARFRAQFNASFPPATPDATSSPSSVTLHQLPSKQNTVHPAILAAVLAWGAKFSDHPLIEIDRNADPSGAQRSRLAKSLIRKAWEIAEAEKVHCVPSVDSVVTCLLLDGLHSHNPNDPEGYRGFWLNCGVRHLLHLQINNRSASSAFLTEPERRNTLVYAWWMACLADAFSSVYFRWKPILEDTDYNIDFYPQDITRIAQSEAEGPGSERQLSVVKRPEFLDWYAASHAMARCAREISRQLWRPIIQTEGIPFAILCSLMRDLDAWRTEHLNNVGVNGNSSGWDFLAAVAACGHDAMYHVMWIIIYQTLRETGIRESNEIKRSGIGTHQMPEFAAAEERLQTEALNAASRIAGLADLLTKNNYLRLDPNVMHYSIYCAGKFLAEFGREETGMCIRGLQQYGIAYDDAFEQAAEIQGIYSTATARMEQVPQGAVWDNTHSNGAEHHATYNLPDHPTAYRPNTAHPHPHPTVPIPRR